MEKLSQEQFFAQYPEYSNFDKLKEADILIMPYQKRGVFDLDQTIFQDLSSQYNVNCLFYSENPNSPTVQLKECYRDPDSILNLGIAIINTISALIPLYLILRDKTSGRKFNVRYAKYEKDSIEIEDFEGTIEQFEKYIELKLKEQ